MWSPTVAVQKVIPPSPVPVVVTCCRGLQQATSLFWLWWFPPRLRHLSENMKWLILGGNTGSIIHELASVLINRGIKMVQRQRRTNVVNVFAKYFRSGEWKVKWRAFRDQTASAVELSYLLRRRHQVDLVVVVILQNARGGVVVVGGA